MDAEIQAFIEEWLRENASVLDEVVRLAASNLNCAYGAAVARHLADLDTERHPDA